MIDTLMCSLFCLSLFFFFFSVVFQPSSRDKKSELLPADWSSNKELYSLRYRTSDTEPVMVLKAIAVDSTLIFNLMVTQKTGQMKVADAVG